MKTNHIVLLAVLVMGFVVLNILDMFLTLAAVQVVGTLAEGNPLGRWVLTAWGISGYFLFKMYMVVLVAIGLEVYFLYRQHSALVMAAVLDVVMVLVVVWNIIMVVPLMK